MPPPPRFRHRSPMPARDPSAPRAPRALSPCSARSRSSRSRRWRWRSPSAASPVDLATVVRALGGDAGHAARAIVRELRLPRALAAFATGGLLALAGALMQVLLRNPLADPYVLGISGGAAVGRAGRDAGRASPRWRRRPRSPARSLSTLLVFGLARGGGERAPWTATRLLLTGVVVAVGLGRADRAAADARPRRQVKGMLFWLIGDLSAATHAWPALAALARRARRRAAVRARPQRARARRGRRRGAGRRGAAATLRRCYALRVARDRASP